MTGEQTPGCQSWMNRREFIAKVGATVFAAAAPAHVLAASRAVGSRCARGIGGSACGGIGRICAEETFMYAGDMPSDVFELEVNGRSAPLTAVPRLPASEYPALAAEYAALPSYCSIEPSNFMGVHYVWLTASGPLELTLTCPGAVKRCVVHPLRRRIRTVLDGKRVNLSIDGSEPRYFIVEIDDYPPIAVVVDPPETDVPQRDAPDVLDVGEALSARTSAAERTAVLEEAFRKAAADRMTVYVPAGEHRVGPIRLHNLNGARIYLASGSLFRTEVSPAGANVHSHGLWLQDSQNVRIWGRGCLDHGGFPNFAHGRNAYNHGLVSYYVTNDLCPFTTESPLFMLRCRNVTIEGLMVRNGRNMNFNLRRCDDVTLRHCKILTPPASTPEYGDGFHTNSCVNVLIENCLAYCNDDCFASGHYTHFDNRDSGVHEVRGLVGWNPRAQGVRLGFHTYYNLGDFSFENCDFSGFVFSGILVHPLKDAPEARRFQRYGKLTFRNCGFDTSRARDVLVDMADARMDVFELFETAFEDRRSLRIHGHGRDDGVKKLVLSGVTLAGDKLTQADLDLSNVDAVDLR